MADPVSTGLFVGGAVLSAFGKSKAAKERKERAKLLAAQKRRQAAELGRRLESEINFLEDQASENIGTQKASFAANGISVGSTSSVQAEMKSFENLGRAIHNKRIDTALKQANLRLEAKLGVDDARSGQKAATISGIVDVGNAVAKAAGG